MGAVVSQEDRDQTVTEKNEAPLSNEVHNRKQYSNTITLVMLSAVASQLHPIRNLCFPN